MRFPKSKLTKSGKMELKLDISEKARKKMESTGGEGHIIVTRLGGG